VSVPATRPGTLALAGAPDASELIATVAPAYGAQWAEAFEAAADGGILVAGRERAVAGLGVAATLTLPCGLEDARALEALVGWLAAVECCGHAGAPDARVIALGAFAFDRTAATSLVVPKTAWCKEADSRMWRVEVRRRDGAPLGGPLQPLKETYGDGDGDGGAGGTGAGGTLRLVPSGQAYAQAVARALRSIEGGVLAKVVLARMVELDLLSPPRPCSLLGALQGHASDGPSGHLSPFFAFSIPTPRGRLVGASPELIVARRARTVVSHAFAGTVQLSASDTEADVRRLAESTKDLEEHRLVVEEIVRALKPYCTSLHVPGAPSVVRLRSDARLGTLIRGTLHPHNTPSAHSTRRTHTSPRTPSAAGAPETAWGPDSVLTLLARLHPTPAVGGVPRAAALAHIAALEAAPRGYWAGAAGWVDGAGDGEWVLAIRSAELDGQHASVRAGAGIVAGSEPARELAETTIKLRPVLESLWPGSSSAL
jgi:isochorismate synthase